ncbi:hypothetical protein CDAR_379271 [Caerostris darwini]|uniref:Uncharacterized protein n=1 Tax=Caerostris darwini TaxID=1538125 RepID=A0AAV4SSG3_9ARAC|nr:hypothetical protein CDAR_379271 [Caerostris darwini]
MMDNLSPRLDRSYAMEALKSSNSCRSQVNPDVIPPKRTPIHRQLGDCFHSLRRQFHGLPTTCTESSSEVFHVPPSRVLRPFLEYIVVCHLLCPYASVGG